MTLWHMLREEIHFRRLAFILGCASVAVAVAAVVGSLSLLRSHDLRTEKLVEQKEAETREAMKAMENDYRIIMKRMGYNVMILPAAEKTDEMRLRGFVTSTMPFEYAERLAASDLMSLNHQLPVLQRQVEWREAGETILLCGVRGQMALAARPGGRSPIQAPIPQGSVALGNAIAAKVNVTAGETVTLFGEKFRVERVDPSRGTIDDMTVWADLAWVQQKVGANGLISGILALECVCHADQYNTIVADVQSVLPDVQVFEFTSKVQGRAEARQRAAQTSRQAIAAEQEQRQRLRTERARLAVTVSSLAIGGASLWVLLLAYGNARDRRGEIGLLRAVGLGHRHILALLLGKALVMGAIGGAVGALLGVICGAEAAGEPLFSRQTLNLAGNWQLAIIWLLGPALAVVAALWPSLTAAAHDPAEVLGKE